MRYLRVAYKCLVGRIVHNQSTISKSVINPLFELAAGYYSTGGIIRVAKIHYIELFLRDIARKSVLGIAGYVFYLIAAHQVGIHLYRIYRVCNTDKRPGSKDITYITRVAFGSVINKNVIGIHLYPQRCVITFHYGLS